MAFAQGNQYESPRSGVGAYLIGRDAETSPQKAYVDAYDTVNRWRREKDAEKAIKQQYIKDNLKDLDFSTKGVLPTQAVKERMLDYKDQLLGATTAYGVAGQDPYSPQARAAYDEANRLKKGFQSEADLMVEVNDKVTALDAAVAANPNNWNVQEYIDFRKKLNDASYDEILPLMKSMPRPRSKSLNELLQSEVEKGKPTVTSGVGKQGLIQETTTFGKKINPQTGEVENDDEFWLQKLSAPQFRDATMQEIAPVYDAAEMELPPDTSPDYPTLKAQKDAATNEKQAVQTFVETYNKNHPDKPIDFVDGYGLLKARTYGYTQQRSEGQDAWYKQQARVWGVGQEEAKKYGDNFWQLAKLINGSDEVYEITTDASGNRIMRTNTFLTQPAGVYKKKITTEDGEEKYSEIPNTIIDIQRIETPQGDVTFKYKTAETNDISDDATMGIANGYRTTKDPNEVVTLISAIANTKGSGVNSGKFSRMFYDWSKNPDGGEGFWEESTKSINYGKLRKLLPVKMRPEKSLGIGAPQYGKTGVAAQEAQEPQESTYTEAEMRGIQAVMKANNIDEKTAIEALKQAGKLK